MAKKQEPELEPAADVPAETHEPPALEELRDNVAIIDALQGRAEAAEARADALAAQVADLEGRVAQLESELAGMAAAAEDREARRQRAPRTCINCGQRSTPIEITETGYRCPACHHEWTDEEEQAPFRRGR
jgi:predicted Zn-ribbon and HTH transcriptional regulator